VFHLIPLSVIQWLRPLLKVFNLDKLNYNNDPQTEVMVLILYKVLQSILKMGDFLQLKNHLENYYFLNYPTRDQEKTTTMRVLIIQTKRSMFIEICIAIHNCAAGHR
jgi:hypothetical protein